MAAEPCATKTSQTQQGLRDVCSVLRIRFPAGVLSSATASLCPQDVGRTSHGSTRFPTVYDYDPDTIHVTQSHSQKTTWQPRACPAGLDAEFDGEEWANGMV